MSKEREFKKAIAPYTLEVQNGLLQLRALVLQTAAALPQVGPIEEALKWNQPSFLTPESGSGSTIRVDGLRHNPKCFAMYFHCQSGLIEEFKLHYGSTLKYDGKRAIIFDAQDEMPIEILKHCISLALTHHLRKKSGNKSAPNQ